MKLRTLLRQPRAAQHAEQLASRLTRTAAVRHPCRGRIVYARAAHLFWAVHNPRGCRLGVTGWQEERRLGPAQLQCAACCQA